MERIDIFRHAQTTTTLHAGEVLFEKGDPADLVYSVIEGEIEVEIDGTVVGTLGPGQIVGEMGIIEGNQTPRTATVRAVTESRLVPIDEDEFKRLVERVPHFALNVLRIVAERLRQTDVLIS